MSARHTARAAARALPLAILLLGAAPAAGVATAPATGRQAARVDIVVRGRVTDAGSGAPIEGAQVFIAGTGVGAVSNANGHYLISHAGVARGARLTVTARRIGYQSMERVVRADSARITVDFALASQSTQLSQVVVSEAEALASVRRESRKGSRVESGRPMPATVGAMAPPPYGVQSRNAADASGTGRPATGGVPDSLRRRSDAWNTEEYARIEDNPFLAAAGNPLSTFSIDVDRASYANVRRYLGQGARPPKDAVRIEELVNYFRYDYAGPRDRHPVAIHTELAPAPWQPKHHLLRVGVQGRKIDLRSAPANNLVFLIDVSGSMQPENKLPLLRRAFRLLVDELREEDQVSIVVYAGAAGLVLPPTSGGDKAKIHAAIDGLEAGGSTAGGAGIKLAYDIAQKHFVKGGNNRVILATDGDFNVGVSSTSELVRLVEERREHGTFLTVLGFGMGNYKDARLEQLADKGNGNYAYIDDLMEAKKTLVTELGGTLVTIAKDVKLQLEFNPSHVAAYRLIGYENRMLRAEDFNDDRKDAGELGAGHTVTALYEIVPVGVEGTVTLGGVDSLRYSRPASRASAGREDGGELAYVKLRYKEPDGATSRLLEHAVARRVVRPSADFTFAAAVAGFGMLLRESPHKGTADWRMIARLAREGRGTDEEGYRAEFIRLVDGLNGKELAGAER